MPFRFQSTSLKDFPSATICVIKSAADVLPVAMINWKAKGFSLGKAAKRPKTEVPPCVEEDVVCSTEAFSDLADRLKARRVADIRRGPAAVVVRCKPNIVLTEQRGVLVDGFVTFLIDGRAPRQDTTDTARIEQTALKKIMRS